ncbi:MAG: hypothetical protein WCJ59_02135 [bacterium]
MSKIKRIIIVLASVIFGTACFIYLTLFFGYFPSIESIAYCVLVGIVVPIFCLDVINKKVKSFLLTILILPIILIILPLPYEKCGVYEPGHMFGWGETVGTCSCLGVIKNGFGTVNECVGVRLKCYNNSTNYEQMTRGTEGLIANSEVEARKHFDFIANKIKASSNNYTGEYNLIKYKNDNNYFAQYGIDCKLFDEQYRGGVVGYEPRVVADQKQNNGLNPDDPSYEYGGSYGGDDKDGFYFKYPTNLLLINNNGYYDANNVNFEGNLGDHIIKLSFSINPSDFNLDNDDRLLTLEEDAWGILNVTSVGEGSKIVGDNKFISIVNKPFKARETGNTYVWRLSCSQNTTINSCERVLRNVLGTVKFFSVKAVTNTKTNSSIDSVSNTAQTNPVKINFFTVTPQIVNLGKEVLFNWDSNINANDIFRFHGACAILDNNGSNINNDLSQITGNSVSGSASYIPKYPGTYLYNLYCESGSQAGSPMAKSPISFTVK